MEWSWVPSTASAVVYVIVLLIWKPWTNAYAGEKGKNLARKEDLDQILDEVRAVAAAQKETEVAFHRATWHYETLWTHQMSAYASVIAGMFDIRDGLLRVQHANADTDADPRLLGQFEKAINDCTAQMTRFNQLVAAAILVGDAEVERVLRAAMGAVAIAFQPNPAHVQSGLQILDAQCIAFMDVAKKHLGLPPNGRALRDASKAEGRS